MGKRLVTWFALAVGLLVGPASAADSTAGDGADRLWEAVERSDVDALRDLLRQGVAADSWDRKFAVTPLMRAAEKGALPIVELLLAAGATVAAADGWGGSTLHYAVTGGHVGVVKALLKAGAPVESRAKFGFTPLSAAVAQDKLEIARLLIEAGAAVDPQLPNRATPLMVAAREGRLELVRLLAVSGADISACNGDGETALSLAREQGHEAVAAFLSSWKPPGATTP